MPLWGLTDAAANSVKYATELVRSGPVGNNNANKAANNTALYGAGGVVGAYNPGMLVTQVAVTAQEYANASGPEKPYVTHLGWNMRYLGTGPVASIAASVGGTGYSNTDLVRVSGNNTVNATGTLVTNSTGGITSMTLTNPGAGFLAVSRSTMAVTNSTAGATAGSGATLVFTLGGRAGRIQYENIVAMGSLTSTGNTIPANT